MSWETKSRWLRTNPVTAAKHFHHRLNSFFKEFLKTDAKPIGEITDYVIRIEFQARGSPHAHTLIWIKDAPKLGYAADDEVTSFIDKYVTCELPSTTDPNYEHVTKLQRHSCSSKCRRKNTCRFHFPRPPASKTIIAKEVTGEHQAKRLKEATEITTKVKRAVLSQDLPPDSSLEEILHSLQIGLEAYMSALAVNKHGQHIILKRTPSEVNIQCLQ